MGRTLKMFLSKGSVCKAACTSGAAVLEWTYGRRCWSVTVLSFQEAMIVNVRIMFRTNEDGERDEEAGARETVDD